MTIQVTTTPPGTTTTYSYDANGGTAPEVPAGSGVLQFQDVRPDGSLGPIWGPEDLTVLEVQDGGLQVAFPDGTVVVLTGPPQQIASLLGEVAPAAGDSGDSGGDGDSGGSSGAFNIFIEDGFGGTFVLSSDGTVTPLDPDTGAPTGLFEDPNLLFTALGDAPPEAEAPTQAPVALDFAIGGEIPVGIQVSMSAADIASEFGTDADSDLDATSLSFESATVDGLPVPSLADIGFSYTPGIGDAGGFVIDTEAAAGFFGLGEGETAEVEVTYKISDGVNSDTGVLAFTVTGTPGTFDVEINYLGVNVAGQVVEADAESEVGEAEAEVEYSGAQMLRDTVDDIDISQAAIGDFFDDIDGDFFDAFQADDLTGAFAVASENSTADAFAIDGSQSEAAARSGSAAVAIGESGSEATAVADDDSTGTAVAAAEASARSVADGGSLATTVATNDSTADAVATGNSTAIAVATVTTDASAAASDNSRAVATSVTDSMATAEATQNSEAIAEALLGSTAQAAANDASKAEAIAVDDSTGIAVADDGATAKAEAGDQSTGADGTSDATAQALSGSTVTATATGRSSAVASAANQSEADATASDLSTAAASADVGSEATATAEDSSAAAADADQESDAGARAVDDSAASATAGAASSATATAEAGSAAEALAENASTGVATAETGSVATATASNESSANSSVDDGSSGTSFATDGSAATAQASDNSIANAKADTIVGVADSAILLTGPGLAPLFRVDSFETAGPTQQIVISGLPAGSVLSAGTPNGDGSVWTFTGPLPDDLTLTPPAGFTGEFVLTGEATTPGDEAEAVQTVIIGDSANAAPVAFADAVSTDEDSAIVDGNVLGFNGSGLDYDPDGDDIGVTEVNGNAGDLGTQITLGSGALLTLNADGTFSYDPNGQFEALNAGESDTDSFTYTIGDGNGGTDTATVTVTIDGADEPVMVKVVGLDGLLGAAGTVSDTEVIDLSGNGDNTLALNLQDLLRLSDRTDDLLVSGDPGDRVTLTGDFAATGGTEAVGGETFVVYESAGTDARLLAEQDDIQVTLITA